MMFLVSCLMKIEVTSIDKPYLIRSYHVLLQKLNLKSTVVVNLKTIVCKMFFMVIDAPLLYGICSIILTGTSLLFRYEFRKQWKHFNNPTVDKDFQITYRIVPCISRVNNISVKKCPNQKPVYKPMFKKGDKKNSVTKNIAFYCAYLIPN